MNNTSYPQNEQELFERSKALQAGNLVLDYSGVVGWIAAIEPYMADESDICLIEWLTVDAEPAITYMTVQAARDIREHYLKHKASVLNGTYEHSPLLPSNYPPSNRGGDGI